MSPSPTPWAARLKPFVPRPAIRLYHRYWQRVTPARRASNAWLAQHAADVEGRVRSIGSGHDRDKEGGFYRDYFTRAAGYTTSEVSADFDCDLVLDVRHMPEIADGAFDAIYCSGVLEHVDDPFASMRELTRILRPGGILLLGLPFRQPIHGAPHDYWRFTEFGHPRAVAGRLRHRGAGRDRRVGGGVPVSVLGEGEEDDGGRGATWR